jgi:hypothetical protein
MGREVIEIAFIEIDGQELQTVMSIDVSDTDPGAEVVKTMRRNRKALGHKSGVSDYELDLEVKPINPPELDWHGLKRNKTQFLLVYEENDGGLRYRCEGSKITEVGKGHNADGESVYRIKILCLGHEPEIQAG